MQPIGKATSEAWKEIFIGLHLKTVEQCNSFSSPVAHSKYISKLASTFKNQLRVAQ